MLDRIAKREDPDQTALQKQFDLGLPVCLGLFDRKLVFKV